MPIGEANTGGGEGIEIGLRNGLRAVGANIAKAHIIAVDEDDIGLRLRGKSERGKGCYKKCSEDA